MFLASGLVAAVAVRDRHRDATACHSPHVLLRACKMVQRAQPGGVAPVRRLASALTPTSLDERSRAAPASEHTLSEAGPGLGCQT